MGIARWRLKELWTYPFSLSPVGEDLYEWLTAVVLGTQSGMSRKWCYWFREHLILARRYGSIRIQGRRIWLFQPGWSLAPVILGYAATGTGPWVTEGRRCLADRYARGAIRESAKAVLNLHPGTALPERLRDARTSTDILRACDARYLVGGIDSLAGLPDGQADFCMSMGRLEHFTEVELSRLFAQMRRILAPGGVGSHIIDNRDHYWHYDKAIHCFHHLTYTDAEWERISRGRKRYRNRLLEPDYVRLFEEAGFEVVGRVHDLHKDDANDVDPRTLSGRFSQLSTEDLRAAVSHLVVRRP